MSYLGDMTGTDKYIKNIITGEIILPNNSPNLTQILFKGVKIFEFNKPKIKKISDKISGNIFIS